jgi:hypothetical protein
MPSLPTKMDNSLFKYVIFSPTLSCLTLLFSPQDARSSNGTMVYLQGPLPLPNNEILRLRMGRATLSIKAKRSIAASVRGALHRLPSTTPCTASLSRLQEILALAPPHVPKSARHAASPPAVTPPPVEVAPLDEERKVSDVSSPTPVSPLAAEETTFHSPPALVDHALILGPERKDGGSGREVTLLRSPSPPPR